MFPFPQHYLAYHGNRNGWKFKAFLVVVITFFPILIIVGSGWLLIQFIQWVYRTFRPPESRKPKHVISHATQKSGSLNPHFGRIPKVEAKPVNQITQAQHRAHQTAHAPPPLADPEELRVANKTILAQAEKIRKQNEIIGYLRENEALFQALKEKYTKKIRRYRERISKLEQLQHRQVVRISDLKELLENALKNNIRLKRRLEILERENWLAKAKQGSRDGSPLDPTDIRINPSDTDTTHLAAT